MAQTKPVGEVAAAVQKTVASPTTSATQAGSDRGSEDDHGTLIEAINQVFALFRLNYNNQYYAAWSDAEQLRQVKRLWLEALNEFPSEIILRGARVAIESSDYLPTLNKMLQCCRTSLEEFGLPDPRQAYLEACLATSPKVSYNWTHPAVYFAGRDSDWFFLANNPESITWPVFQKHYEKWLLKAVRGESLTLPQQPELAHEEPVALDPQAQKNALAALRKTTGL